MNFLSFMHKANVIILLAVQLRNKVNEYSPTEIFLREINLETEYLTHDTVQNWPMMDL